MLFSVGYVIVGVGLCGEMWLVHGIPDQRIFPVGGVGDFRNIAWQA